MNVANCYLELSITDKQSGEEWQCSYDSAYIENLTRKTGNFKQFDIFTTMLKSGFLKTSECISLDLLTYEDLESLRIRRIKSHTSRTMLSKEKCNRRYLILIYNVEFDRILYPLPLEYCGPPDPSVLQATIRKLEMELTKIKTEKRPPSNESSLWILQKR
ncbi:PREDICTED: coiled-coil domain-containing protein 61-like isoform X2 [Nicrophorus vespilloides]|nr:PREDICTED: coiled-coil domain-containing protein 61-like isoform X2 [Nicrophorus vespilloides]